MGRTDPQSPILWFSEISKDDVALVGGKNANLGEMLRAGVPVPPGFAVTAHAYRTFLAHAGVATRLTRLLQRIDPRDLKALHEAASEIQEMIRRAQMPSDLAEAIREAYRRLGSELGERDPYVAVRSSATAEDLPTASFAGQQETYLNVRGADDLLDKVRGCFASLFTPRAIAYRTQKGFDHERVYLSVAVQKMVNSRASGVMFTLHPVTGDKDVIVIEGTWGLGELVVRGEVTPDEYVVRKTDLAIASQRVSRKGKRMVRAGTGNAVETVPPPQQEQPALTEEQIRTLARLGLRLEEHYGAALDIEWALDADDGNLYIVQCRPETVWSAREADARGQFIGPAQQRVEATRAATRKVEVAAERVPLVRGLAASPGLAAGDVRIVLDVAHIDQFQSGEILVTEMTTPDWVPAMLKAAAIVTNSGGMTSHAAIVSRELGVPCVVGTGNATEVLRTGQTVTVDGGNGIVYEGILPEAVRQPQVSAPTPTVVPEPVPVTGTKILVNLGVPDRAEDVAALPADGVGLMRQEFIIATYIGDHPLALIERGEGDRYVDRLADGIARVARAFAPRPVVLRLSDFKTNEYRELRGGEAFEPTEENPMLGWRGASRYVDPVFERAFDLELRAILRVRNEMALRNVWVMVPFVRTVKELGRVLDLMRTRGLERGPDFKIWMMCEVPSNVILADRFAPLVDGFSVGSNDLTQLILGVDRESGRLSALFDERDEAVLRAIRHVIRTCHRFGTTVSICGQAPSVYPEMTEALVRAGIDSVSVNPDAVVRTRRLVAQIEQRLLLERCVHPERAPDSEPDGGMG
ncbi:MAG: phosphoenolpyruvate synthase [Armatimonadota bacterium]|nr:phosphoenolpyruvate synthase [Armatimonadota bacterium]MDR5696481.1 phosphoenolpyruvate synthase [Armatimonadota bacterium]